MPTEAAMRAAKAIGEMVGGWIGDYGFAVWAEIIDREMGIKPLRPAGRDDADGIRLRQQIREHNERVRQERKLEGHANAD